MHGTAMRDQILLPSVANWAQPPFIPAHLDRDDQRCLASTTTKTENPLRKLLVTAVLYTFTTI